MSRSQRKKFGFVTLIGGKSKFKIRYFDPTTKKDVRRVLPVGSEQEAIDYCWEFNKSITGARGMVPSQKNSASVLTIQEAMATALKSNRASNQTKRNYLYYANSFVLYMEKHFPVKGWKDVKPSMLKAYVIEMENRGLSYDSIRLNLEPIRQTSVFWASDEPDTYHDVFQRAKIRLKRGLPKEIPALSEDGLKKVLSLLEYNSPMVYTWACLQALSGLRLYEVAMIRYCDVDFTKGTLTIDEVLWHKPKNLTSYRTIPLHPYALSVLKAYIDGLKVVPANPEETIFKNMKGGNLKPDKITKFTYDAMLLLREADLLPKGFSAKHFRHTFATMVMSRGGKEFYLKKYIGHSHGGILGRHYVNVSMDDLRKNVVDSLPNTWHFSGTQELQIVDFI